MPRLLFRKALHENSRLRKGDGVLVAVSGGADSVCLLHLFADAVEEWGFRQTVGHFNHRLRGDDSDEDALFVRSLSGKLGLPFTTGSQKNRAFDSSAGGSLQGRARKERLNFLLEAARRAGCRHIALGHNADDQAETMIMRFLGGSGPAGLGGIAPLSHEGRIFHPLLGVSRRRIVRYLSSIGAVFREDRSNSEPLYLRNRVRLELLPRLLSEYNPNLVSRLCGLAELMREEQGLLDNLSREVTARILEEEGKVTFPRALLRSAHPALLSRVILAALRRLAPSEVSFGSRHISALLKARDSHRFLRWTLPGGITAVSFSVGLILQRQPLGRHQAAPFLLPLPVPGTARLPGTEGAVTASVRRKDPSFRPRHLPGIPWRTSLDWGAVEKPLSVRSRLPGDRYRPLGLGGEKKLKELLIDGKVPRPLRDGLPVVTDARGIIWVAGIRPAHRCRVTERTGKILFLRADEPDQDLLLLP